MQAVVYSNRDGYYIHAMCMTTDGVLIASEPFMKVKRTSTPEDFYEALMKALRDSALVIQHPTEWGAFRKRLSQFFGTKSVRDFEKKAKRLSVEFSGDILRFVPYVSSADGDYEVRDEAMAVELRGTATALEVTKAIEEVFQHRPAQRHDDLGAR